LTPKLAGIALVVIPLVWFLNATSFCYYRGYVPQQELFESAIRHQASNMGDLSPGETPHAYLEKYPDCCSMCEWVPPDQSFLNTVLGCRIRYVRVAYRMKQAEFDQFPKEGAYYEAFVEIAPCGTTLHRTGMRVDQRPGRC
jgi:hypothetical protein